MACKIHNVRFYNLEPRSIVCLCYNSENEKLALARNDNSIELWNVSYAPFLESTIVDHLEESIEQMIFIDKNRLLSTGLRGFVTEYNLKTLSKKKELAVTGGASWCLDINPDKTRVAVGTEDGYINIFTVLEDFLRYEGLLDKQKGRILCIKWDTTGNRIFTGSSDTVRVWDAVSGHVIHKMTTPRKEMKKETIVWCLGVTKDNHIVSGDSRGVLSIWDPEMGTLIESHNSHSADVLALTITQDSKVIYCAGVDPVVRTFAKLEKPGRGSASWVKSIERRLHLHDVRALVEVDGKLYSAGVDGYLAQSSYPPKMLAKYPPLLQSTCVTVCPKKRRVLLRYVDFLELWELGSAADDASVTPGMFHLLQNQPKKLLELRTKWQEPITSYAISKDSKLIVYSTETHMRIFKFGISGNEAQLTKSTADRMLKRVHRMIFSPNGKLFVANTNASDKEEAEGLESGNRIHVYRKDNSLLVLENSFSTKEQKINNIGLMCFSPDSEYLVCSDRSGRIIVYTAETLCSKSLDWWPLPKYSCPPTAMAVQGSSSNLVVVYADHKIIEYNLLRKQFTEFSNNLQGRLPTHWLARHFPITNVTFDPKNDNVVILHDDTTVYALHKNRDFQSLDKSSKIRRLGGEDDSRSSSGSSSQMQSVFQVIKKYKHLVHLEWFNQEEMVAVEVNPISLTEKLPPTLKQKFFGV